MYLIYDVEKNTGTLVRDYVDIKVSDNDHIQVIGKRGVIVAESKKGQAALEKIEAK